MFALFTEFVHLVRKKASHSGRLHTLIKSTPVDLLEFKHDTPVLLHLCGNNVYKIAVAASTAA